MNKRIFCWLLSCWLCWNAFAQVEITKTPRLRSIEEMLTFAMKHQRKPYRAGAVGPNAFDCSGFTCYCYKQLGIELLHSSQAQALSGMRIERRHLKEGDLVFFRGNKGKAINHVGIVYKKKRGKRFDFIHASTSLGVVIENCEAEYFKGRYVSACRITSDKKIKEAMSPNDTLKSKTDKPEKPVVIQNRNHPETAQNRNPNTYIVKENDTLYNICKRFGCNVEDLRRWNNLKGNTIVIGQELKIVPDLKVSF